MRKVHEFIQNHDCESGAACLAMICDYYGNRISVDDACALCDVTVNGCSPEAICYGAGEEGLHAVQERLSVDQLREIKNPCIAVCTNERYMVVEAVKGDTVFICTSIEGHRELSVDEFLRIYTGNVITFTKVKNTGNAIARNPIIKAIQMITDGLTGRIILYSAIMIIATLVSLKKPDIINTITNALYEENEAMQYTALVIYAGICLLGVLLQYFPIFLNRVIREKISIRNNVEYVLSSLMIPINFYERNGEGDLVLRKKENDSLMQRLTTDLLSFIIEAIMVIGCSLYIVGQSAYLSFVLLLMNVIAYVLLYKQSRARDIAYKRMCYYLTQTSRFFYTSMAMLETIKAAGTEYTFFRKHANNLAYATESESEYFEKDIYGKILPNIFFALIQVVILVGGIYELSVGGHITIGGILACFSAYNLMRGPLQNLINTSVDIPVLENSADRVLAVRDNIQRESSEPSEMIKTEGYLEGDIEVRDITFAYSRFAEPVIKNISFTIHKGEHVALVGRSGCGKTTIKNLLTGRYQPNQGSILFDGISARQISGDVKANSIGAVDQKPALFAVTVGENITMWDETIEDYEMTLAAYDARIYDVIAERPNGFKSQVQAHGSNFSGGECQRLEIARALAREPRILILDEATSALDARTEKQVVDRINERGITTITIAHRLSTIRNCDRIYVIDDGEIIDAGTHDALMHSCELYRNLVLTE